MVYLADLLFLLQEANHGYNYYDDNDIFSLAGDALINDGNRVFGFNTVHAFNRKIFLHLPDLFIMDLNLPDDNGIRVTEQLAAHRVGPVPPVIVMPGNLSNGKDTISNGARFFLPKPFHMNVLLSTIKSLLAA